MKTLITTLLLLLNIPVAISSDYEKSMQKGIEMLQQSGSATESVAGTNYFVRMTELYPSEWLPAYYAAYGSLKAGLQEEDRQKKDEHYQSGLSHIRKAKSLNPGESEIFAMEGYLMLMYIANDAMKRAPSQTADAMEVLETAKAMNPGNPRPWFVQGQHTLFTPEFFGGGAKNAKPLLEKAVELYNKFSPANEMMPVWGKERCEKLLEQCR